MTIDDYIERRNEIYLAAEAEGEAEGDRAWAELGVANRHIDRVLGGVLPLAAVAAGDRGVPGEGGEAMSDGMHCHYCRRARLRLPDEVQVLRVHGEGRQGLPPPRVGEAPQALKLLGVDMAHELKAGRKTP